MDSDEAELDRWMAEHNRLNEELRPFVEAIRRKKDHFGDWTQRPSRAEKLFDELNYFYNGVLLNEGSIFQYLDFMIPRRWQFEAVRAQGCLDAMDGLTPFFDEYCRLETDAENQTFWNQRREDINRFEFLIEDPNILAQLLLEFARRELAN